MVFIKNLELNYYKDKTMSFAESVETCFRKYADFSGQASRSEFWWFVLFQFMIGLVAGIANQILFGAPQFPIQTLVSLGMFLPGLAVGARRLHDINKSGWWQLLWLGFFLIIPMIYIIVLHARKSAESNKVYRLHITCKSCGEKNNSDENISFCGSCGEKI